MKEEIRHELDSLREDIADLRADAAKTRRDRELMEALESAIQVDWQRSALEALLESWKSSRREALGVRL